MAARKPVNTVQTIRTSSIPKDRRTWYIDKSVPLALIFTVFMQTVLAVWWASGITKDVEGLKATMTEFKVSQLSMQGNRYTSVDANKDLAYVGERHNLLERRVTTNEERLREIERKAKQ